MTVAPPSQTELQCESRPLASSLEVNAIELFVRIAQLFGVSKSIGEIYGLLFVSPEPVSLTDVRMKLRLSSGSTSQGLRLLRQVGAVRTTYVAGDRRDYFVAETGLRTIAAGFLRERLAPLLADQDARLEHLTTLLSKASNSHRPLFEERIQILQSWRQQTRALLPMVMQGLDRGAGNAAVPQTVQ